ncbi:hypothetical protein HYQ44_011123 [Verticillium longisporum]|nr:hypothetical protein HYQ44_011123 [Verticillium longisporum]
MMPNSGLLRLPNEMIIQIAKLFLQDIDPFEEQNEAPTTPLRNLCLTSRHLFSIAQPVLVSHLTLEDVYSTILFIRTLREKQHLRNYVIDVNRHRGLEDPRRQHKKVPRRTQGTDEWGRAILSTFFLPSLLTLPSLRQLVGRLDVNPGAVGPFTATQAPALETFFTLDRGDLISTPLP